MTMTQQKPQTQAQIIDGKALAKALREQVARHVQVLISDHKIIPGLAVVLVGDDPASAIYVGSKEKLTVKAGMRSYAHRLPQTASQDEVLKLVQQLNKDKKVHGILVQMPLPKQVDEATIMRAIDPTKDVDGLHVENMGRLLGGLPGMVPCTPMGCVTLIKSVRKDLSGLHAVVIGRSNLVGKPVAQLLLRENCTVTMCHSRTKDIASLTRQADIVVAAVGRPKMIKGSWIKPGAIVIDVGINREGEKILGDVDFDEAVNVAGYITPVPGGVGPMTIACLLGNTVIAACRQNELTVPQIG
jgi:methylenetetrahydrofolate dehydrogenase (NADP+)/methenyltetrahydrofolate cyclohydrolase